MTTVIILIILAVISAALFHRFGNRENNEKAEQAAKRLARLLISEIKLYETYKVERGFKNNNLYESLKSEIETAKKKYRKSFPEQNFTIFFDKAVLNVLADGHQEKLGSISTSLEK